MRRRWSLILAVLLLAGLGVATPGAAQARGEPFLMDTPVFVPMRPPVLGFVIEHDARRDRYRLVEVEPGTVHREGDLDDCQDHLVELLVERWGRGRPNLAMPTPGGLQFWGDVFWFDGWRIQEHVFTGHYRLLDPADVRHAWGTRQACRTAFEAARRDDHLPRPSGHLVVLLHGLGRTSASMAQMQRSLEAAGYATAALTYPSTRRSLADHADQLVQVLERLEGVEQVSFVTHSLGGIVVRAALARDGAWRERVELGRVVMLAPPSNGSSIARDLEDFLPAQLVLGPVAKDLAADEIREIPPPPCPFGVIAAGGPREEGWNPLLEGDDDGVVSVEETRLEGADDFLVVRGLHTFLMNDEDVIAATLRFLEAGRFAGETGHLEAR